jgi:cytochrome c oxidase subunit 3
MASSNGEPKGGTHGNAGHPKHLAHHWETSGQQFQAGKTGMWLFLSTEILLFGGLFCAYAVYRHNHPDVFLYAHRFLDKKLGGINTLVLILSSLTAAWSVRAAQLNQQKLLRRLIVVTLVCGVCFMGIKSIEYNAKWKHGLLWGKRYHPTEHAPAGHGTETNGAGQALPAAGSAAPVAHGADAPAPGTHGAAPVAAAAPAVPANPLDVRSNIKPAPEGPRGLASETVEAHGDSPAHAVMEQPQNVQVFFSIYFAMTGLHALHVIAGMSAWLWVLRRARRGDFSSEYYTPVDLVALYWHLVDLIWIYLFPLLYLIH